MSEVRGEMFLTPHIPAPLTSCSKTFIPINEHWHHISFSNSLFGVGITQLEEVSSSFLFFLLHPLLPLEPESGLFPLGMWCYG